MEQGQNNNCSLEDQHDSYQQSGGVGGGGE